MVNDWVRNGKALSLDGGKKFLYVTIEGATFVANDGTLVTVMKKYDFDEGMQAINWDPINLLPLGDLLVQSDGNKIKVDSIELEEKPVMVYNMTVVDFHMYFVTQQEVAESHTTPLGTVKIRFRLAMKQLKDQLANVVERGLPMSESNENRLKLSNETNIVTVPVEVPIAHATPLAAGQIGRVYRIVMTIGLSVAIIILTLYSAQLRRDVHDLKSYIAMAEQPTTALKVNEAVVLSPAATDIVAKGLATVMTDRSGTHLVVQVEKLPELKGNQAFQVWLLKDKKPVNAGTFLSRDGNGALYYTFESKGYAITLEPDALGKEEPRGTLILAAPIKETD